MMFENGEKCPNPECEGHMHVLQENYSRLYTCDVCGFYENIPCRIVYADHEESE